MLCLTLDASFELFECNILVLGTLFEKKMQFLIGCLKMSVTLSIQAFRSGESTFLRNIYIYFFFYNTSTKKFFW